MKSAPLLRTLCLTLLGLAIHSVSAHAAGLQWHTNYTDALAEAERTGKPLFLEFRCVP